MITRSVERRILACASLGACIGMPAGVRTKHGPTPKLLRLPPVLITLRLLHLAWWQSSVESCSRSRHGTLENGTVLLENGKITAVGPAASVKVPKDAQIYNAKGMTVYPGLFDAETQLGLVEVGSDQNSSDLVEKSDEIFPQMRVVDAFHAETVRIPVERISGVTNAIVAPASEDSVAGQDALIQLYGKDRNAMMLSPDIALAMNFEGDVRRRGSTPASSKFPSTRMGLASQLRQTFLDTQNYMAEKAAEAKPDFKGASNEEGP